MTAEHIPREFIQLLLSRIDVVDLIDARIPLRKKSNNNYFACCPFHNEKSASFSVSQVKQFYYCFGCGAHGTAIDFLMEYERLSFPEAIESLAKQIGMAVPRTAAASASTHPSTSVSEDSYQLLQDITQFYQTELRQSPQAISYLKRRGVSGEIARDFKIGFAPAGWDRLSHEFGKTPALKQALVEIGILIKKDEGGYYDRFRERIIFPIHDRRGRVIGFGGRILDKGEPKYLNSPETTLFKKGQGLYGLYQAITANRQLARALVVEGYMDVVALFQHGINYAVATLGTAATPQHIQRLFRYTSEIVFCFDGDQAGRTAAWRALLVALPYMTDAVQVRFMFLPEGEDPDTLIRKEGRAAFEERIQHASSLSHFFFQTLSTQADLSTMEGRARFVDLAQGHLKTLPAGVFQQMMREEIAKKARIDIANLPGSKKQMTASPSKNYYKKQILSKGREPSTIRLSMILLVQQPGLASHFHDSLMALKLPGMSLFIELIKNINEYTLKTTGALLECWRDRPEKKLLEKLARMEHNIPEEGIENEFIDAIEKLKKRAYNQIIEQLLAKAEQGELSIEEKKQLQTLIHQNKISAVKIEKV